MKDNIGKEINNSELESRSRREIISKSGAARRASDRVLANDSSTKRKTHPKIYCTCVEPQGMNNEGRQGRFLAYCGLCKLLIKEPV